VAHAIRGTVRSGDISARLGGDEFAVLLIATKPGTAEPLAQRLLQRIRALGDRHPGLDLGVSIGMALFDAPPERAEEVLQRADAAMYQAKSAGKHRFSLWTPEAMKPVLQA
jgi:diguanylate cyclase